MNKLSFSLLWWALAISDDCPRRATSCVWQSLLDSDDNKPVNDPIGKHEIQLLEHCPPPLKVRRLDILGMRSGKICDGVLGISISKLGAAIRRCKRLSNAASWQVASSWPSSQVKIRCTTREWISQ